MEVLRHQPRILDEAVDGLPRARRAAKCVSFLTRISVSFPVSDLVTIDRSNDSHRVTWLSKTPLHRPRPTREVANVSSSAATTADSNTGRVKPNAATPASDARVSIVSLRFCTKYLGFEFTVSLTWTIESALESQRTALHRSSSRSSLASSSPQPPDAARHMIVSSLRFGYDSIVPTIRALTVAFQDTLDRPRPTPSQTTLKTQRNSKTLKNAFDQTAAQRLVVRRRHPPVSNDRRHTFRWGF